MRVLCILITLLKNLFGFLIRERAKEGIASPEVEEEVGPRLQHMNRQNPAFAAYASPWDRAAGSVADWIRPRVLELVYTSHSLEPFARDLGYDGSPFVWDVERRFSLRCVLDTAFFHLYGIIRDDTDYIMDTFPIVRKRDEVEYGEYRTKRVILERYGEYEAKIAETTKYFPGQKAEAYPDRGV